MDEAVLTGASDLSAAWLGGVLGAEVESIEVTTVGTGQMADTVRAAVTYAPGSSGPGAVIVKVASADEHSRQASKLVRCYEIETAIYRDLEPLPGVPRCLHAARDEETDLFTLVLEDLSPCTQGDDIAGTDLVTAKAALRTLAHIHAVGWQREDLAAYAWLNRQTPEQTAMITGLVGMLAPQFLDRFGPLLSDEHRALVERIVPKLPAIMTASDGPKTLGHGDFRLDNMLFRPGETDPWIVDWQTAVWTGPASDVAYFVGGSLKPETRRAHAAELLDTYHAELEAQGVTGYSREQLEADVRRASFGGVVMAFASAILVVQTERGDRMFAEMFSRHAQHALDLDAEGSLPVVEDTSHVVSAEDDLGRHEPDAEPLWNESWYADVVSADGSVAAYVRLGLYPNLGTAWWHAVVVGEGRDLVLSAHTDLPVPQGVPGDGLKIGADGVDLVLSVDEALQSFTVRGTMTAGRYADPSDVYSGAGEPATIEIDATWRTDGTPYHWGMATRYEIPCVLEGAVVVDGTTLDLSGPAQRDHSWGARDWWSFGWCWLAGHLDDGTRVHAADIRLDNARFINGYVQKGGVVTPVSSGQVDEAPGLFPATATAVLGDLTITIEPTGWGPILLTGPNGEKGFFPRAAARFSTADGRTGTGWVEWNQPQ